MNILNNMSVNKKLMAGFGLVLLLTAGLGITAYTQVTTMDKAVVLLETAAGIEINVLEVRQQEKNYQLRERQQELDRHAEAMTHLQAHISEATALVTRSEDKALLAETESAALAYDSAFDELVKETREMRVIEDACAVDARAIETGIRGATYLDGAESAGLLLDLQMIRRDEKNFIMRHDAEYVDDVKGSISTLQAAIDASALTASDKSAVKREIGTYQATFMELVSTINSIDGYVATTGPLVTHGRAVQADAQELAASAQTEAAAAAASAKTAVVAFVVIAIVLGMVIALVISKSITNPLNEVMTGANKIRDGDFGYEMKVDSNDELGELARVFGEMKANIQSIVAETERVAKEAAGGNLTAKPEIELKGDYINLGNAVDGLVGVLSTAIVNSKGVGERVLATAQGLSSAAEEMNAGMEQLASSSQQVAEGSQKLAELAQTTARDVEEVSSQIEQTSSNASSSAEKGQSAVDATHEVQDAAQKTLDGLAQIQEGVARTSETVGEMNSAIEKVGEMGEVITDVAGQTNMLGLNAAIEAARAGEAGRGFAVVADAVKNLAEKVKEAAGESGMAIGNIQESGENAIGATGTAVEEATKGGELLHTALDGITNVVGSIDEVNSMVQEIDSGAKNAATVVKNVVAGMDEVASISEESASAAEESSAAVQQQTSAIEELTSETQVLTDVAQSMMDELGKFTVRE
ncbi:MAG: methyl-accepting chemotaxis protein [Euryarchaeota archaeon]|nr:methyl-accepting chemotaxis protein [Euryarchaeota archaeon]